MHKNSNVLRSAQCAAKMPRIAESQFANISTPLWKLLCFCAMHCSGIFKNFNFYRASIGTTVDGLEYSYFRFIIYLKNVIRH